MPSSRSQSSPWLLALVGILSVLAWLTPKKQTKALVKTIQPQDRTAEKKARVVPPIAGTHHEAVVAEGAKKITYERADWVKVAAIAQAVGVPVALALVLATFWQTKGVFISADTARKELEMTDRPWIRDTVVSAFQMGWQQGSYLGWAVNIRTENVGHSVATGIYPEAKMIAIEGADFIDYPRREAKKVCDDTDARFERMKGDPTAWANSVFPGDARDFYAQNVYLLPSEVERKSFDGGANVKSIMPMLVGCIVYHYPSSERAHHTGFVYSLSHNDNPALKESSSVFFSVGKDIPKDNVVLKKVGQSVD